MSRDLLYLAAEIGLLLLVLRRSRRLRQAGARARTLLLTLFLSLQFGYAALASSPDWVAAPLRTTLLGAYELIGLAALLAALPCGCMAAVRGGAALLRRLEARWLSSQPAAARRFWPSRRRFLRAANASLWGAGFAFGADLPRREEQLVTEIDLPLPPQRRALAGTVLVQISDLHVGPFMGRKRLGRYFDRVRELNPDLIVITGDLMNLEPGYLEELVDPLQRLEAPHGVYAILGNHDFYFGADPICAALERRTAVHLLRQSSFAPPGLPGLTVLGIDDPRTPPSKPHDYPGLRELAAPLRPQDFNLLLSHRPDVFTVARGLPIDLILAGHTHGGQIALRVGDQRWNLTRLRYPYDRGHFRHGRTHLYVNRGLGYVGPPVRINCPPEITRIRLAAPPTCASART